MKRRLGLFVVLVACSQTKHPPTLGDPIVPPTQTSPTSRRDGGVEAGSPDAGGDASVSDAQADVGQDGGASDAADGGD